MRPKSPSRSKRDGTINALRKALEARPEVLCAYLHGSFVSDDSYRDVDVAVWIDPARPEAASATRYALDLSTELTLSLGEPVDVQVLNGAPLAFRHHAFKGQPLVVRDREWLDELRARTWDDYFDFLPFARRYLRELLGREVNPDRLRELAGHLRDAVRQLGELGQAPRDAFLRDARTVNSAKYLLIVATEAALDICNHLAARKGGRSPVDYADCMVVLAEVGAIDETLRAGLVRMARFRNLLVHHYAKVDDSEIYRIIRESLGDFDRYLASIAHFLKAELC